MAITRRFFNAGSIALAGAGGLARPALADSSPILIGYPAALTGPSSAPSIGNNRGVGYVVNKINAAGGVNGRKIEMVTRDTQGDPTKSVNAVQEMISSAKVHALWGPNNSGEGLATTPIVARRNIPNVHICGVNSLVDKKYPQAYRIAPNNLQCAEVPRRYCHDTLKAANVAVIGDSTGYGTMMVTDSATDVETNGLKVTYRAQIDAGQPDLTPDMLRMRESGAQAVIVWTVSTGLVARLLNARAAIGWDVPFVGHSTMGSGDVGRLLDKPGNWDKVYIYGTRSTTYDANGKLPERVQAFVAEIKGKIELADTTLWWVLTGADAINLIADAVRNAGSSPTEIEGWWNQQTAYPALYANYRFTDGDHNGFPDSELVMSKANSGRDGAFALAPT
ncbi:ABC transporter substrate-binding protein [Acidisphaera sp. L21]|jgi:branched-chain amino acid transport system substrate-binding protein|uniref:ABC transporter substrate-binding protein n=1 Tax=Acidisphaera sp. L21 TaxID=1641851 RepID=UPI00131CF945|nr:ABC transporter substrate-binding protein [Acidisphaera sp. L21]